MKIATLLLAAVAALSLNLVAAGPAQADEAPICDTGDCPPAGGGGSGDPNACRAPWQGVYVASNRQMESCEVSYDIFTATLTAKTNMYSRSIWGFHGCVKALFINASGNTVQESPYHRWGISGGDFRTILWTETGPSAAWHHVDFVHWQC